MSSGVWLYQMSADEWEEAQYRFQVWEGTPVFWASRHIKGSDRPKAGDRMICWYATTRSTSPGLCGWGVVLSYDDDLGQIVWRPIFPTDLLKMRPLYDAELKTRVGRIRGKVPRGTIWPIPAADADWLLERVQRFAQ